MAPVRFIETSDIITLLVGLFLVGTIGRTYLARHRRAIHTTKLNGPANTSVTFGLSKVIATAPDPGALYESWMSMYGPVYEVPAALLTKRVVVCDPKAIAHFYSKETYGYVHTRLSRSFIAKFLGRGLLWAEGDSHKRQRKALSPAFSNAAIRKLTSVFFDSSYKLKNAWDSLLESSPADGVVIDVQNWMNHVSLDSIGIAGFSHDFGTLDGRTSAVSEAFDSFGTSKTSLVSSVVFLLGQVIPGLTRLPTTRNLLMNKLHDTTSKIADQLLEETKKSREGGKSEDKSIIGLLLKAESAASDLYMSQEEVMAQMNVLILAGYETTSISLTWALVELSKHPEVQTKLREELSQFAGTDPTYEQLSGSLPYLDAVVHEILRLHPALPETSRVAAEDDIIPLSSPITTASGQVTTSVSIAKGSMVTIPINCLNRSEVMWGKDAKEFSPERWLDPARNPDTGALAAKDIQGHRHLLTFVDGPRLCLGRHFALAEFKAALSVLIRNYTFEFPGGKGTKIDVHGSILPRPKVAGEIGSRLPLTVRRVD